MGFLGTVDNILADFPDCIVSSLWPVTIKPLQLEPRAHMRALPGDGGTGVGGSGGEVPPPPGTESATLLFKVGSRPHTVANGHELFEVSEERDEEVAAFCHMLDV